jgi:regulatory protein
VERPAAASITPLNAALRMLARRSYSVAEIRQALEKKGYAREPVAAAIARLREIGYLDDKKFAEQFAYSLTQNRALGPHRVRRELKSRKVDFKFIEPAVERAFQDVPARTLLEQALDKKLRTIRLPLTRSRFHSLCQSLLRRGFNSGDIIKAVRARTELAPVAEDVEPLDLEAPDEETGSA